MSDPPSTQQLLADAAWLKRLALTLAGNEIDADDLLQESRIAAWSRNPDANRSLRPWLAKVIRDVYGMRRRSERRREAREQAADLDRSATPPDELLDQVRLHRLLADLVLELAEPFRSTIIARFVEGRSSGAIARADNIAESTVRWRIREGLARLRAGLDNARGDRKAWAPAVLAFAKGTIQVAKPAKSIAAIFALLALLLGGVALTLHRRDSRTSPSKSPAHGGGISMGAGSGNGENLAPAWFGQRGARWRRIAGHVTLDGKPVAGASVSVHSELTDARGFAPQKRLTGTDGSFDFGTLPPAAYDVVAAQTGLTAALTHIELDDPAAKPPADQLELRLLACDGSVQGTVVDASGTPIPHAHVLREEFASADTDDHGNYRLCSPRRNDVMLTYGADGYGTVVLTVNVGGEVRQDVVLVPEATLTVRVERPEGTPAADANVVVEPARWKRDRAASAHEISDREGRAHVAKLLPAEYTVIAYDGDSGSERASIRVVAGPNPELVVRLVLRAHLRGRVLRNGTPVAGAEVFASALETALGRTPAVHSQEDGTFMLDRIPLGDVALFASPYRVVAPARVHVVEAKTYDVELEVAPLGALVGTVTRLGVPVADASVCCVHLVNGLTEDTRTDASGHYEFAGALPGTYDVAANSSDAFTHSRKVTIGDNQQTLDLDLDLAAAISGTVVDQDDKPVGGVHVHWIDDASRDETSCPTDSLGRYRCASLSGGGQYRASVYPTSVMQRAFATANSTPYPVVDLANGTSVANGIKLAIAHQQLSISGTVVDDSGAPVSDARVEAQANESADVPAFSSWLRVPTTFTDDNGAFTLSGIASGTYALLAHAPRGGDGTLARIAAGATDATITIIRPGSIQVTLANFSSSPSLTARVVGQPTNVAHVYYGIVAGNTGSLLALPPGRYIVDAQTSAEGDARIVDVRSGDSPTLELTAHGRGAIDGVVLDFLTHQPLAGARCKPFMTIGDALGAIANWDPAIAAISDANGRVTLDPAPAGNVDVVCIPASNSRSAPSARVTVAAGGRASLQLWSVAIQRDAPTITGIGLDPFAVTPRVISVAPNSAAARAGVQVGDVITAVNGTLVDGLDGGGVEAFMGNFGEGITLTLARGATRANAKLTLGSH